MDHTAAYEGTLGEKLETAIQIGCRMVSRSQKVRKKLNASSEEKASLKQSLKEMDRMSMELMDKLFEINARIDLLEEKKEAGLGHQNRIIARFKKMLGRSRKMIESMRSAYQDIYSL